MTENDVQVSMKQILEGVAACHAAHVAHRDLKPQNILLQEPAKHVREAKLKIVDFGISQIFGSSSKVRGVQGTVSYMAPEVFTGERLAYDAKCDVWSLGVICFQLLCGKKPFTNKRDTQIGKWSFGPNFPQTSVACRNFVQKLLTVDVAKRPSAQMPYAIPGSLLASLMLVTARKLRPFTRKRQSNAFAIIFDPQKPRNIWRKRFFLELMK